MKLCVPEKVLNQHAVVLGKTGAGKSSALRHIVEHLLNEKKRVCIIDPKGDWWGLKSGADGKSAGYSILTFGSFKESKATDMPINDRSGKHVAELITSGNRPCVIGFRGWMPGEMTRFWIDFATALFNSNGGELYLVIDECHNFAPKGKVEDPQAGKALHRTNRLMSEGRGLGIIALIASQRPQKVHNDTLTCCETLIAMRVIHAADRRAVKEWIDGCGDDVQGKIVLDGIAKCARGEAFIWSPEIGFGPQLVKFPMFETFDSFAPPQLQKRVNKSGWADVDLEAVKEKLAAVIEEEKANDPNELKTIIAQLRRDLAGKPLMNSEQIKEIETREVSVLTAQDRNLIERIIEKLSHRADQFQSLIEAVNELQSEFDGLKANLDEVLSKIDASTIVASRPIFTAAVTRRVPRWPTPHQQIASAQRAPTATADASLGRCERAILSVLAQYPQGRSKSQMAILSGYSINSSGFENSLSSLRQKEFMTRGIPAQITEAGNRAVGDVDVLPSGEELFRQWLGKLGKCERAIMEVLWQDRRGWDKESLAQSSGYSVNSSGFENSLSKLRTLELITRGLPIKLNDEVFE